MLFVVMSTYYYNSVIEHANILRPIEYELIDMSNIVFKSNNEAEIVELLEKISYMEHKYEDSMHTIYNAFILIEVLCYFNLMFLIS